MNGKMNKKYIRIEMQLCNYINRGMARYENGNAIIHLYIGK